MSELSDHPKRRQGNPESERGKDKKPQTRPMPPDTDPEFKTWAEKQRKAQAGDQGELPPEPPKNQKEPREHGSLQRQDQGA